ncbi:hydroxyacid dehydrogenase [Gammaproteobacteria bacterium]|nr:hydroxyacid dehydrogenase [Gammaproteobacteria bacterium]
MKLKLLCITPIDHIDNLKQQIEKDFDLVYLPDPSSDDVKKNNDADIIFTNPNKTKVFLGHDLLKDFENLRIITTASTGTVHIDKSYCKKSNIKVISITKEIETLRKISSTAELAFSLTLAAVRNLIPAVESVNAFEWDYEKFIGRQLNSLKVGVIGYGRLGKMYAKYSAAFDAEILICDPFKEPDILFDGYRSRSIKDVFEQCDIISLHIHAQDNEMLIDNQLLKISKDNLILINTSRGEVVNESDLIVYGKKNKDFKYFADVLTNEYLGLDHSKLFKYSLINNNFVLTPHIGGMSIDAQFLAYGRAFEMLKNYISKYE